MQAMRGPGGRPLKTALAHGNRFVKSHPLLSKAIPTAIGFAFGDFLTQYMNRDQDVAFKLQLHKTAKMAVVGATIAGPVGLFALQSMNQIMPLALAVLGSEVVGCLIWQIAYCGICPKYRAGAVRLAGSVKQKLARQSKQRPQQLEGMLSAAT